MNVFTIGSMSNSPSFYKHHTKRATKSVTEMFVLVESSQINFWVVMWGQDQPQQEGESKEAVFVEFPEPLLKNFLHHQILSDCNSTFLLWTKVKSTPEEVRGSSLTLMLPLTYSLFPPMHVANFSGPLGKRLWSFPKLAGQTDLWKSPNVIHSAPK